jgi:hypothetical protein
MEITKETKLSDLLGQYPWLTEACPLRGGQDLQHGRCT